MSVTVSPELKIKFQLSSRRIASIVLFAIVATLTSPVVAGDDEEWLTECSRRDECCYHTTSPRTLFNWANTVPVDSNDEEGALVTDRPDFTEASSTVGLGRVQIEMGYTYVYDDDGTSELNGHSYPETLFRIGMFQEWFELRLVYNFLNEQIDDPVNGRLRTRGSDDMQIGAKIALTEQCGHRPEMAVILQALLPTGSDSFTNDEVLPGINWLYSWEINDLISVGGSTQVNRVRDATGHFHAETAQSATVALSLSDDIGAYFEYFGFYPSSALAPGVGPDHFLNGGFTFLLTNDVQFDVRAGFGLNDSADDFFTGTGLSIRF